MQNPITFDQTNFEALGEENGILKWFTPKGDGLGLFHYAVPPDIDADISDAASLRAFWRRGIQEPGLGVIEIEPCVMDECRAVRTLSKIAQQPTGRTYLGALIIPFRDFSYVWRVKCVERGFTGFRDTLIFAELMSRGEVKVVSRNSSPVGWLDDPYDPSESGEMTRNRSERPEYDSRFPDHPLSRARWVLDHLQNTVAIDNAIKQRPVFGSSGRL